MKTIRRVEFVSSDVDYVEGIISETYSRAIVRPGAAGEFDLQVISDHIGGLVAISYSTSTGFSVSFPSPQGFFILMSSCSGGASVHHGGEEINKGVGGCAIFNSREVSLSRFYPGQYTQLVLSPAEIARKLEGLIESPVSSAIRFDVNIPESSKFIPIYDSVSRLVRQIMLDKQADFFPVAILTALRDLLVSALIEYVPNNYSARLSIPPLLPSPGSVRRAIEFIHANAGKPLRVEDIASAAFTSVRSLQTGFAAAKGMSPMAYLREVRLSGVRQDLLAATGECSVREAADRWGFHHMGSFAALYRRTYGELPSETLKYSLERARHFFIIEPSEKDDGAKH
ncbi:AraC family transcriptional regulator [Burkholderia plantarii]|uniref:AraC family transcriptional regulator n=1 Tax=Burkholderia plantarii TaxID=41899 RepID=UPI0018DE243C|nr:AraC family transcriptional regulator [Burkholderia plantarii]MBI0331725.1 AraC family transcriptional regulator [Burkholderia plantarii]